MKPKTFLRNNPWPASKMLRKLLSNKFYTLSTNLQVFFFLMGITDMAGQVSTRPTCLGNRA